MGATTGPWGAAVGSPAAEAGARPVVCDVWFADVAAARPAHLDLLDDVERQRRDRYPQDSDKARFTVAAALLRLVVARETGTIPNLVRIDRTCDRCAHPHGKPRIIGADVQVSLSHSGGKVALAFTREAPVGVDVEEIADRDVAGLAGIVLGPAEPIRVPNDFYTYWCRKEAVVKATGTGLEVPLKDVVVSPADTPARLVSYRGGALACAMRDLPAGDGYAAAVAVLADGEIDVRLRDASGILPMF